MIDLTEQTRRYYLEGPVIKGWQEETTKNYNLRWLLSCEVVKAERSSPTAARAIFRFQVLHEYINPMGAFQGGAQATVHDVCTSWVISLVNGDVEGKPTGTWKRTGTSRTLNMTFVKPAFEGDVLLMECEIVNLGKRLAMVRGVLRREKDGVIISTCEHDKYDAFTDGLKL